MMSTTIANAPGAVGERDFKSHSGGKATCNTQANCEVCHEAYGNWDVDNHERTRTSYANATGEQHWVTVVCEDWQSDRQQYVGGPHLGRLDRGRDDPHAHMPVAGLRRGGHGQPHLRAARRPAKRRRRARSAMCNTRTRRTTRASARPLIITPSLSMCCV